MRKRGRGIEREREREREGDGPELVKLRLVGVGHRRRVALNDDGLRQVDPLVVEVPAVLPLWQRRQVNAVERLVLYTKVIPGIEDSL